MYIYTISIFIYKKVEIYECLFYPFIVLVLVICLPVLLKEKSMVSLSIVPHSKNYMSVDCLCRFIEA